MKLYLIHTGFYDKSNSDGFYEQHTNLFIVAESVYEAKQKIKLNKNFIDKKMHIDGIKEIEIIDGYRLVLEKTEDDDKINMFNHHQIRFLKSDI
tara:strand:+ start:75 stop:356 length:282 start_codon:yes stop_codon:yes gene_type:complete